MIDLLALRVSGQPELELKIKNLGLALDTRKILDQSAGILLHGIMDRFLRGLATDGSPWPVSQAAKDREARGTGGGTLFDTGKLFRSLQVFAIDSESRGIGTDVPYGKFHQYGTVRLPKREFLGFAAEDVSLIRENLLDRIAEVFNG